MKKQYVYVFNYCYDTNEGSWSAVSLHRTKAGAVAAMNKHKAMEFKRHLSRLKWHKKQNPLVELEFGEFEDWSVDRKIIYD